MLLRVGTSGYSYDQWSGGFYPAGLPADERLGFYARRLGTVEINNTFYRMPKREVLRRWADAVPGGFDFAIKASRRITHEGRLKDVDDGVAYLLRQLEALGDKRGPILFQTPPYLRKDVERLRAFVALLPPGVRAAFELRHRGWDDPEVHGVLAAAGHAWCAAELDGDSTDASAKAVEGPSGAAEATASADATSSADATATSEPAASPHTTASPTADEPALVRTAAWGYVRLHAATYDDARLRRWAQRITAAWDEAWVFFSHEETGPALALRMNAIARELPGVELPGTALAAAAPTGAAPR